MSGELFKYNAENDTYTVTLQPQDLDLLEKWVQVHTNGVNGRLRSGEATWFPETADTAVILSRLGNMFNDLQVEREAALEEKAEKQ